MMNTPLPIRAVALLAAVALGSTMGCDQGSAPAQPAAEPEARLPVADADALRQLIQDAAANDQVLVMDFWATWCEPCIHLFPGLHQGLHALKPDVRAITITLDSPGHYEQEAIRFLREHNAMEGAYILVDDADAQLAVPEQIGQEWNNLAVPAILIFDQDGQLAGEFVGGSDPAPILQRVNELVGAQDTRMSRHEGTFAGTHE